MRGKRKEDLEISFNKFKEALEQYSNSPEHVLIIISNYLFHMYPQLYKLDTLYKDINLPELNLPENYSELIDTYAFNTDNSYVYKILNIAHDLLLVSEDIIKKGETYGSTNS